MAANVVRLSLFALLLIAPIAIVVVLGVFKLMALLSNVLAGRANTAWDGYRRFGYGQMIAGAIAGAILICLMVLGLTFFRVHTVHSVRVEAPVVQGSPVLMVEEPQVTLSRDGSVLMAEHLANARQEVQQAVQQPGGLIPVDVPVEVPITSSEASPIPVLSQVEPASTSETEPRQPTPTVESPDAAASPAATATDSPSGEPAPAEPITANAKPSADDPTSTSAEGFDLATVAAAETPEQRQARLTELAAHISPWIRSLLNETQQEETAADVAEAVESSDKQIVVFQLAGPIRQKYALIPLTPAFDAAFSPVSPFLANGSLESIAESLAMFLKRPAETATEVFASAGETETPVTTKPQPVSTTNPSAPSPVITGTTGETSGAENGNAELISGKQLAEVIVGEETPAWVNNPQPHQFVVRTDALFPGESTIAPLNKAINKVLADQLKLYEESLEPALRAQARLVKLEIDEATSQACLITTFERLQSVGKDGADKQDMRFVYALVELPESVRTAALQTVRMSLQRDRVTGLGVIIFLSWLAICFASVVVRLWGRGGFFRKMIAIPILCLVCIPLLLLAIGTGAATTGIPGSQMPRYPWADSSKAIRIQVS